MINKDHLIQILEKKSWNKSIEINFKRTFTEETTNTKEIVNIVNFEFDYFREVDLYNSIVVGSHKTFPIKKQVDLLEYIEYVKSMYSVKKISKCDFDSMFKVNFFERNRCQIIYGLGEINKVWVLVNSFHSKEVLILDNDGNISFINWEFID